MNIYLIGVAISLILLLIAAIVDREKTFKDTNHEVVSAIIVGLSLLSWLFIFYAVVNWIFILTKKEEMEDDE